MGHSLGEYAALVAAEVMSFDDALIAASARAREMSDLQIDDPGLMASVFADSQLIQSVLAECSGYVVAANLNSPSQTVIAGATEAVKEALAKFKAMRIKTVQLAVSHAFHTQIIAPAAPRLRKVLEGMQVACPSLPVVCNVNGKFYPQEGDVRTQVLDLLEQQIAAPGAIC